MAKSESEDATGTLLAQASDPMEQDFTMKEEYELDRYMLIYDMMRSYHVFDNVDPADLDAKLGFKYDEATLQRARDLEHARSAKTLNPREGPTPDRLTTRRPSANERVNRVHEMMQVGKPLGGFQNFYERTLLRCVGLCQKDPPPPGSSLHPDTANNPISTAEGAYDNIALFYAMPIEPMQNQYVMSKDYEAFPHSGNPQDHEWSRTCQMRVSSIPGNHLETLLSADEFADVNKTLELAARVPVGIPWQGSSNVGQAFMASEYSYNPKTLAALQNQFSDMRINKPHVSGTKKTKDPHLRSPGSHIWSTMAMNTDLFIRTNKRPEPLNLLIAEAYNTLLAAVMGITPPIYQLIIMPFKHPRFGNMGYEHGMQVSSRMWWVNAAGHEHWRLIVVSEGAMQGMDGPDDDLERDSPPAASKSAEAAARHKHRINKAHVDFFARRSMSLQTRLAEFGFLMLDNKPENVVLQRTYVKERVLRFLASDEQGAIKIHNLLYIVGDVMAIDLDLKYTLHVDMLNANKGMTFQEQQAIPQKFVHGGPGNDMYVARPAGFGTVVLDAGCIRFANLMIYSMRVLCGRAMDAQKRSAELGYIVSAMMRFSQIPEGSKANMCDYFFHVASPKKLAKVGPDGEKLFLPHEVHRDDTIWNSDSDDENAEIEGPGYSLRHHRRPRNASQVGDDPPWDGSNQSFKEFYSDLLSAWNKLRAWDWNEVEWRYWWKTVVGNIRERVHHYGLKHVNKDSLSPENTCGNILKALSEVNVQTFLEDSLSELGKDGQFKQSAANLARSNHGAVLSFPLVVLALIAMGAQLFDANDVPDTDMERLPAVWPAPPANPNKRRGR